MRGITALTLLLACLAPVRAASCPSDKFQLLGSVVDGNGRPLPDARIFLLLDRVSEEKFAEHGVRARTTRTDGTGRFAERIDCGEAFRTGDQPNPCAKRPRYLTVAAGDPDFRLRLRVFKLARLERTSQGDTCVVQIPEIRLQRDSP